MADADQVPSAITGDDRLDGDDERVGERASDGGAGRDGEDSSGRESQPGGQDLAAAKDPPALTQQERAEATLRSIMSGGNLTAETMKLSNEFTDRHVSRLKAFFRRSP